MADAGAAEAGVTADGYYKVDDNGAILGGSNNFVAEGEWSDYSNAAWKSEWQETYDTTYAESYAAAVIIGQPSCRANRSAGRLVVNSTPPIQAQAPLHWSSGGSLEPVQKPQQQTLGHQDN